MVHDASYQERLKMPARGIMAPHDVALESFSYWTGLSKFKIYKRSSALGMMAMEAGETSFKLGVVGDNGHAWGPFQHQGHRRQAILEKTNIDVATASHIEALAATDYEINKIPPYHHIAEQMELMDDPEEIVTLLVRKFEQSFNPGNRDVRRRVNLYNFWDDELKRLGL